MAMGSFAQGFRFAITLILNMTLQKLGGEFSGLEESTFAQASLSPNDIMAK